MFSLLLVGSMDTTTLTRIKVACWLLLLSTCLQRASPHNLVVPRKRQTEVVQDLTKNFGGDANKNVDEEAFSLEFSGEDYNTLVKLLLDAKNEFIKLQVDPPNNPSNIRGTPLNDTAPEDELTVPEEPDTDDAPLLKSDVTENIYFNPVTPDPGFADPLDPSSDLLDPFAYSPLAQLESVRDRKAKAKQLMAKIQGSNQTDAAEAQGEPDLGIPPGGIPEDALKTVTTPCIPPPQYLPVAYPVPVDPSSPFLYQPNYYSYSVQDAYSYPPAGYMPAYNPAPDPMAPQGRAEDPLRTSQPDGSFTSGDCLSYFCSHTACTAWECTSDPCTSGQCVAKKCVEWSCDVWSNSTLTKVQDVDWIMQPEDTTTRYFDPLSGL